nr:MAG TPA: hypothetical protein [Caudoviricetes sp.]
MRTKLFILALLNEPSPIAITEEGIITHSP